jgi:DNA-binding NtrC family response regulator
MDDDNMIRDISEKMLNKMGFEPFMAQDGEQAIQIYKDQQHLDRSINAVILDLEVKQGMGGAQTIKELLKINPDIKAIIASGYSGDIVMENSQDYGFALALSKPYSMKALKKALEKLV